MRVVVAVVALWMPVVAFGQEIVADRPGLADGSTTMRRGVAQLEIGVTAEGGDDDGLTLPALVRFGLTDAFELRVESALLGHVDGRTDVGPVAAGFKWRLRDGAFPLSLIAAVAPPSGGGRLRSRDFEAAARLVSDIELGSGFSLTPNVGVVLAEGGGNAALIAASLERPMGRVLPFVDFEAVMSGGNAAMIVDGGVAWIVRDDTQLDLSAGVDVAGDAYPEWFVAAGYSRRF